VLVAVLEVDMVLLGKVALSRRGGRDWGDRGRRGMSMLRTGTAPLKIVVGWIDARTSG
jgi:hypothetical protein